MDVTVWGEQGENVNKYLSKGSQVTVQGYMKEDSWETESGERRTKMALTASYVLFGAKPSGSSAEKVVTEEAELPPSPVEEQEDGDFPF
jgi:single-strand DNA-binding protein